MNEFKCFFYRHGQVPPVLRVVLGEDDKHPLEVHTLARGEEESGEAFWQRAQQTAFRYWLRYSMRRWTYIEAVYEVPSPKDSPNFFDDERRNTLSLARRLSEDTRQPAEVQIAAIKLINRVQELVPPDVKW